MRAHFSSIKYSIRPAGFNFLTFTLLVNNPLPSIAQKLSSLSLHNDQWTSSHNFPLKKNFFWGSSLKWIEKYLDHYFNSIRLSSVIHLRITRVQYLKLSAEMLQLVEFKMLQLGNKIKGLAIDLNQCKF